MRYRICDHISPLYEVEENDIYRKFRYQFDNMLNADEFPQNDEEFFEMYVHDPDFEESMNKFLLLERNSMKFCVGYTGIGKTTSIRYCLELGISNVTRLETRSKINPRKYMVIFPTFLDGARHIKGDTFDFIGRIASVCTTLEEKHPELREILRTSTGRNNFYAFIRNHTPRILETRNDFDFANCSYPEEIVRRLSYAQNNYPYEYYANKLKYYIKTNNCTYDHLLIVLDDIESLPEKQQHEVITEYLHFFSCMNNTDIPEDVEYRIKMLISVRPHTIRLYRHREAIEKYRGLEAFSLATNTVLKKNPIDLSIFFQKRFDFYTNRSGRVAGNRDSWDDCYENLMLLNNAFEGQYKSMIINLCFLNVRAALSIYAKVFSNRYWVQGNRSKESHFTVDPQEYSFNNINVIRAIGCGNLPFFSGADDSVIPNIFLTSHREDLSVFCLLVIAYFTRIAVGEDGSMEITYGLFSKQLSQVLTEWEDAVGKEYTEKLNIALAYLFEKKVLRKSIEDTDDVDTMDTSESLRNDSKLYISPRGYELWLMLRRDSVLFEMLRECAWREYDGRENTYSRLPSYELMNQNKHCILYTDLLEYVDYLREIEESVFFNPNGCIKLNKYRKAFGASMVVTQLLTGIEKSLRYSGQMYESSIYEKFYKVQGKINESTRRLQSEI